MEKEIIEVGMGHMQLHATPSILVTRGLGSCVGITLYDRVKKIGAMAHSMLPDINKATVKTNKARFVNSAIEKMFEDLRNEGCNRLHLEAKLFGGAKMFSFISSDSCLNLGEKNVAMAREMLLKYELPLIVQEVGGTFGRTIEFNLESGMVLIRTVSFGEKEV